MSLPKKWFMLCSTLFITTFLLMIMSQKSKYTRNKEQEKYDEIYVTESLFQDQFNESGQKNGAWRHFSQEQINQLSKLGRIMFLEEEAPQIDPGKTYKILIWKYGHLLENRHIKHYTKNNFDPFQHCSVRNCEITYEDADLNIADMVIFHLHQTKGVSELPQTKRDPKQIWTFLTDESPYHTFLHSKNNTLPNYNGYFNWSMSYRQDTDVPVPYGRAVTLKSYEKPTLQELTSWKYGKKQDVLVSILGSNCGGSNHRYAYVKELKKHIPIDMYGGCGTLKCPGHFRADCDKINEYKFYLAFENSNCDSYITEKLWWNAFSKNAVPVVMGSSRNTYEQLLPPHSYINTEDFASPRDLANYILYLNNSPEEFQRYFNWKKHYKILNEHGYFQSESYHYCRACEALNYNSRDTKIYSDLETFWKADRCFPAWDDKSAR